MNPPRPLLSREFVLAHKRSRILDAVASQSAEHGYDGMTVTDIVNRAGIARKTLYESYDGKEEVFLAAVDAACAALFERTSEACAAEGGDWPDRVRAGLSALLDHLATHPAEAHMLIVTAPAATPASAARYQDALARFTALLRDAAPAGDRELETLEEMAVGGVARILNVQVRHGEIEQVSSLAGELCDGVLAHWA